MCNAFLLRAMPHSQLISIAPQHVVNRGRMRTRYSDVYNVFFSRTTSAARSSIHKRRLTATPHIANSIAQHMIDGCRRGTIATRFLVTHHLHTLSRTQTMGTHLNTQTRRYIFTEHRLAFLAWVISRLRPLQRKVLDFLWKPNGPMAQRSMREGLSAIRCVAQASPVGGGSEE